MNHQKCFLFIVLVITLFVPRPGYNQSGTLNNYIEEGISRNILLEREGYAVEQQKLRVKAAKAKYLPMISLDASYLLATGGRTIDVPLGDILNPVYSTLNELTNTSAFPQNLENRKEALIPNNFHDSRIRLTYPIYNQSISVNQKLQEQLVVVEESKLKVFKANLKKDIKVAYYNYFKTFELIRIYKNTDRLLRELLAFNQKLVKHDKAREHITASVEYEIDKLQSNIAIAQNQQRAAKAYFNILINRNQEEIIQSDLGLDSIILRLKGNPEPLENLINRAKRQRAELIQTQEYIHSNDIVTELNEKKLLPSLGAEATAGFQGTGYKFNKDQAIATIGIGLDWVLFDGKQRKLEIQESQIRSSQLQNNYELLHQQIEVEVINAFYTLEASRLNLIAKQAALKNAKKSYELIQKQYENQKALLIELMDAQTKFINAQVELSLSQFDLLINDAVLERTIND